jgi:hypothetical protein
LLKEIVDNVYLCWQLFDVPAVAEKFPVKQVHRKQAELRIMIALGHLLQKKADRVIATVCNNWQAVKGPAQVTLLLVSKDLL